MLILRITVLLVLFVLLINLLFHRPLLESFLFALALAVGLTPELLPMIVSVTLARGALRMAKERVIVKRLAAIHDLGSMDVLCTDKTGTLTEAKIRLVRQIAISGADSPHVLELAWLNSHFETGIRSPLDDGDPRAWRGRRWPAGRSSTRCRSTSSAGASRCWWRRTAGASLVVKGAPEDVLRLSSHYERAGAGNAAADLDPAAHARAEALFASLESRGVSRAGRRLARSVPDHPAMPWWATSSDLVFAGFVAFLDPPKQARSRRPSQALGAAASRSRS